MNQMIMNQIQQRPQEGNFINSPEVMQQFPQYQMIGQNSKQN